MEPFESEIKALSTLNYNYRYVQNDRKNAMAIDTKLTYHYCSILMKSQSRHNSTKKAL